MVAALVAPEAVAAERVLTSSCAARSAVTRAPAASSATPASAGWMRPRGTPAASTSGTAGAGARKIASGTFSAIAPSVRGSRWSACSWVMQTRSAASSSSGRSAGGTGRVTPSSSSSAVDSHGSMRTSASPPRSVKPDWPSAKISSPPSSGRAVASVVSEPGHAAHHSRRRPGRPSAMPEAQQLAQAGSRRLAQDGRRPRRAACREPRPGVRGPGPRRDRRGVLRPLGRLRGRAPSSAWSRPRATDRALAEAARADHVAPCARTRSGELARRR